MSTRGAGGPRRPDAAGGATQGSRGRGVRLAVAGGAADKRARRVSRGARHGLVFPDVGRGAVRRGERSGR